MGPNNPVSCLHNGPPRALINSIDNLDIARTREDVDAVKPRVMMISFKWQKRKMTEILGWDSELVEQMELIYKDFLCLVYALRNQDVSFMPVPSRMIDEFWHMHMLDTRKYFEDCAALFGEYLHHNPYFGMDGKKELAQWVCQGDRSNEIWSTIFGQDYLSATTKQNDDGVVRDLTVKDAYDLDREFYSKLSTFWKTSGEIKMFGPNRPGCRPTRCP
jgi:hypothetical protein